MSEMIEFRTGTLRDRLLWRVWPAYRRRYQAAMREAIRELVMDPSLPCMVDGRVILNGWAE
jgi:hypothetical protein